MALNNVILMGRITQELELKQTQSGTAVLSFTLAVEQSFAKKGEEKKADFISCVAWKNQAEFISKYFSKGKMIAIVGNLRTRNYEDKNGSKHYVTEVYVDSVSFTGEPKQGVNSSSSVPPTTSGNPEINIGSIEDFEEILSDDGVPF